MCPIGANQTQQNILILINEITRISYINIGNDNGQSPNVWVEFSFRTVWTGLSSRYTFPFIRSAPRRFLASGLRRISPEFSLTNKPRWQFGDFQEFCCLQNSKTSSSNFHIYPSPPREQSDVQSSVSGRQHWSINQTQSNILKKL